MKHNKPFRTPKGPKKFSVYVKDEQGKTKKVSFGDPDMEIKRDDPKRRKAFRDRHDCENPGPKTKARYWSCKFWSKTPVSKLVSESKTMEPAAWVVDEDLWARAKKAASKAGGGDLYALTTYIYKRMGGEMKDRKEASSVTTNAAVARTKESEVKATKFIETTSEAITETTPTRFRVALIQEGMGNLRDGFFYSKDAIKSGVKAFDGRKCFADHPSRSEENDRPERSVRDIVGHFENLTTEENIDGSLKLVGDLVIPADAPFDWARALMRESIKYAEKFPEQYLIGLSINANGEADEISFDEFNKSYKVPESCKPKLEKARTEGLQSIRIVSAIGDAVSCDLVTEPGARGKILSIIESEKEETEMKRKIRETEEKKELEKKAAEETSEAIKKETDGDDEHEDVEKDKKLILDMIKKHMGDDADLEDEDAEEAAMEAYEAYKELGEAEEEAMKCAAKAMKLAKHMAAKEAKAKEADEAKAEADDAEADKAEAKKETKKESEVIRLEGRVAFLERELKKRELAESLDRQLKECGLGRAETDKIRKLIGEPKSDSEISKTIKIFKEAFSSRGESEKGSDFFVMTTEKKAAPTKAKAKIDFNECV